jgi:hypothetical protein
VFITEGEKDTDNVAALGLCATTVAGGVWEFGCANPLHGRDIYILEDNDEAGRVKSLAAASILRDIVKSVSIISFTELPRKGDVTDWLAIPGNDKAALEARCISMPVWTPESVLPPVPENPPKDKPAVVIEPLSFVDFSSWKIEDPPEREWGLDEKFAMRTVGMFSGEGGTGKSLLALQLALGHAITYEWLGIGARPGSFIYLSAEDDAPEIQIRQTSILRSIGADFSELKGKMHLLDHVGKDALLGVPDGSGLIRPTKLFERLLSAAIEIKPVVIILDTTADIYAGNENDRAQVRQFVSMLRKLALMSDSYVLINSHVSLTGIASGTGTSGSTGWHNSVRSRMYLTKQKLAKDEIPDENYENLRRLEFMKSNYSALGSAIDLGFDKGIYRPVAGLAKADRKGGEINADYAFLKLLDRFNGQGRTVSPKADSKNGAARQFPKEGDAQAAGLKKRDIEAAQIRLFEAGRIKIEATGPPSRREERLVSV